MKYALGDTETKVISINRNIFEFQFFDGFLNISTDVGNNNNDKMYRMLYYSREIKKAHDRVYCNCIDYWIGRTLIN